MPRKDGLFVGAFTPTIPPPDLRRFTCHQCQTVVTAAHAWLAPEAVFVKRGTPFCFPCWLALVEADWQPPAA